MRNPDGVVVGHWDDTTVDLPAGGVRSYEVAIPLTAAMQGNYTIQAFLRSATGATLANAESTISVQEVLSRSLFGELQILLPSLYVGQTQNCSGSVTVLGTQGVDDLSVRMVEVQLSGGALVEALATQAMTLPPGGNGVINASFDTSGHVPGDYACALQYADRGDWQSLAYRPFVLLPPPVIIGASVTVAAPEVHRRDSQTCSFTVTNSGAGTAQNLLIERILQNDAGMVVAQQSSTVALAGNGSLHFVQSYPTDNLPEGQYRCKLDTVWDNQRVTYADAAWTLLPPVCPTPQPAPGILDLRDDRDLIVNGSFEEFDTLNQGQWGTFPSIPGWDAKYGPLEIQTSTIDGIAQKDGQAHLELDSQNNSEISQWVPTDRGGRYELLLWYSPRVETVGSDTNDVEIWWNDQRVQTLSGSVRGWREVRVEVVTDKPLTELKLKATGISDKFGGLIDHVRLYCIACRRANLIENGSFERHPRPSSQAGGYFPVIPGWRSGTAEPFEIQHDAAHQINVLEGHAQLQPDGRVNSGAIQTVSTRPGRQYGLDLFHAADVPVSTASNPVEVWWDGILLDTLQPNKTGWYMKRYPVTATGALTRLEFRAVGTSDGRGGVIDNVQLTCAMEEPQNLIGNGSFEEFPVLSQSLSEMFMTIPGWTAETAVPFEIQKQGFIHGFAFAHGTALLELDGNANSGAYQDVATDVGRSYTLHFHYSPRLVPHFSDSSDIEIWWGSDHIATLSGQVKGWKEYTYRVVGAATTTRLTFRAAGRSDAIGGLIDNVRLTADEEVPWITSTPVTSAMHDEAWHYRPEVTDAPDGYVLMLEQAPTGLTMDEEGELHWPNPVRGDYPVRIRADDGCGGTAVQTFTLSVGWPSWCPLP